MLGSIHAQEFRWERSAQKVLEILYGHTGDRLPDLTPRASAS
jgi:hypothetical protein